jgi:UDP-N-acetylmuramate--alanine ligase
VRSLFGVQKCTVIFQPHLFSRTKDFATEFAESLSLADEVILLPIYPAREAPMPGVTSELIFHDITISKKRILSKEIALQVIASEQPKLLVMCGAGDIDALVQPIKNILLND